jgi:hypothetical protein
MVYALQNFKHYLLGKHFKMFTDHLALKYLVNKPEIEIPHTIQKHEVSKGKDNGHIKKGNKREKESRRKKADRTAQGKIKSQQGLMGHHIKRANWIWKSKCNGKYKTTTNPLNPHLWCINHIMGEESSTSFMTSPYNTRAQE